MAGENKRDVEKVAEIVRLAGGRLVGRTRLQKIGYLLELSGVGEGFSFGYRHYGPYSEQLAVAADRARDLGLVKEEEHSASWGGSYSVYTTKEKSPSKGSSPRAVVVKALANCDPIELELAATAAYFAVAGEASPWNETARRKPEKAEAGRIEKAKKLYQRILTLQTPKPLPRIPG